MSWLCCHISSARLTVACGSWCVGQHEIQDNPRHSREAWGAVLTSGAWTVPGRGVSGEGVHIRHSCCWSVLKQALSEKDFASYFSLHFSLHQKQTQTHSHSVFLLRQCVHDRSLRALIIPVSPAPSFLITESPPHCCFPHFVPLCSFPIRSRSPLTQATTELPRFSAFTPPSVRCF